MTDKYVLDKDGNAVLEPDFMRWAKWYETADRHVAIDRLPGDVKVSTVFLSMDHSFDKGTPILWETMIFGGPEDQYQERYATRKEALAGHAKAVNLARQKGIRDE